MCLVTAVPAPCVGGVLLQAWLKAAGNIISVFLCHKAVLARLPIQQQRITVDIQLLAVAGIGSDCQGDSIAQRIFSLIRSYCTVCKICNIQGHLVCVTGLCKHKGNSNHFALIAVMLNTDRGNLVTGSNACHRIGFHHSAVHRQRQHIISRSFQLKCYTVTVEPVCQTAQVLPAAPTGQRTAGTVTVISICSLIVDDTERIAVAVVHRHTQNGGKANLTVAVLTVGNRLVVLGFYRNGLIFALDIHPPGIVVIRIVGFQDAMRLISSIETVAVGRS